MDLALNNLQRLICHKTQQTKPMTDVKLEILHSNTRKHSKESKQIIIRKNN